MSHASRATDRPASLAVAAREGEHFGLVPTQSFDVDSLALAEQSAGIGVWSIDLTTGLVRATAQFFRIMGLEPTSEPVPVERVRALRHPDDRARVVAGFREVLEGGRDAYEIEYRIVRPDGELRWIFGRGRIVRDAAGAPVRYSGVDLDITDRKAAQAELAAAKEALERMNVVLEARVRERTAELETEARRRADAESRLHQAQKMEAVGQLTGGIAHDFNNILQVILGNLQIATLMLRRVDAGLPARPSLDMLVNAIETAQKSARSAGQLVHRLLAFSRRQTLEPEVLDANQLIAGMEDMMARTLGETIELRTALAPGLWNTYADRNQLETALLNLVVNARDAMPDGGRVTIETANARIDASPPGDLKPGEYVELVVRDTGEGIPAGILDKVFDPFFTTKDTGKGSGLGLSMVYGFVQQSGGHVRIESAVGRGCAVRIHLPRANARSQPSPAPPAAPSAALPRARDGETVLLVEDNADVRRFAATALEGLGYRVLQASDARGALDQLDARPSATLHLLFTDVVLPGGVSGRALADAVCARQPGLPVLFTSGYTGRTALDPGPLVQDVHVLAKPYAIEDLAARVRDALDRAAPHAPDDRV